jgi:hypothetical protein
MDLKKAYYYIICLVALFVFFWGIVDLSGSVIGLSTARPLGASLEQAAPPASESDQSLDVYYQKKMLYDRLSDSLARIVIAGLVFAYCRNKVNQLES